MLEALHIAGALSIGQEGAILSTLDGRLEVQATAAGGLRLCNRTGGELRANDVVLAGGEHDLELDGSGQLPSRSTGAGIPTCRWSRSRTSGCSVS